MPPRPSVLEIFLAALRLGCTSFGGPIAHLAFFRREYVEKRRWLDEAHYADLVALCQFLPGPASSQTGFGLGYLQRGFAGGVAAWIGFTLPSALVMIALAQGLATLGSLESAGWLKGLKAVAVAVVAQAVWSMWRSLCPDPARSAIAGMSAGLLLLLPATGSQIAVIAAAGLIGWRFLRPAAPADGPGSFAAGGPLPTSRASGWACLTLFALLLLALPVCAGIFPNPELALGDRFYRAGALVFGGGHVVLPLLEREIVASGWVTHGQFLAGYGAAQALPGPLFAFSGYLGALSANGAGGWPGGLIALGMIFLPGLLLVAGTMPWWQALRHRPAAQGALRGANASVVGLLLAALVHPVGTAGLADYRTAGFALLGFAALQFARVPAWALVGAAGALGAWLL